MTFRLRIPGRDYIENEPAANPANPLIREAANGVLYPAAAPLPISRLAGLAGSEVCTEVHDTQAERGAIVSVEGVDALSWTDGDIARFIDRRDRLLRWGWTESKAEAAAEQLVRRDRDGDDRKSCIECAHAGPGWRCARREAFMVDQLQRCPAFNEIKITKGFT